MARALALQQLLLGQGDVAVLLLLLLHMLARLLHLMHVLQQRHVLVQHQRTVCRRRWHILPGRVPAPRLLLLLL